MCEMRVLFLADCLRRGGSERQLSGFLNNVPYGDLKVSLLARNTIREYEVPEHKNLELWFPERPLTKREYFRTIRQKIASWRPHIVHAWEKTGATGAAFSKLFSGRSFRFLDGTSRFARKLSHNDLAYWTFKFNHKVADLVIGNSLASLAAHGHIPEPDGKYVCIPNGIDLDRFVGFPKKAITTKETAELVMVANFTSAKDHSTVITGISRMLDQGADVRITFVGDGPLREKAELVVPTRFRDKFCFLGKRSDVDLIIRGCSIGILLNSPGHAEGMSNSVMEYMAAGMPVVCTAAGGNRELVENRETGYLVEHSSVTGLVEALTSLINDPVGFASMGKAAKLNIEKNYSMEVMVQSYLRHYRALLA